MTNRTELTISPRMGAHLAGVAAGVTAREQVDELSPDTTFTQKLTFFWLKVGTELVKAVPDADDKMVLSFVRGAKQSAPEQSAPEATLTLRLDHTQGAAFGNTVDPASGATETDQLHATLEIGRILHTTADRILNGDTEGSLLDSLGQPVGVFVLNLGADYTEDPE